MQCSRFLNTCGARNDGDPDDIEGHYNRTLSPKLECPETIRADTSCLKYGYELPEVSNLAQNVN